MPLKARKRASAAEDYESDGGFVANDDAEDRPKAKRAKTTKTSGAANAHGSKDAKQAGAAVVGGGAVDSNGDVFWEVSPLTELGGASRRRLFFRWWLMKGSALYIAFAISASDGLGV